MFVVRWLILQAKILKNSFKERKKQFLFRIITRGLIFMLGFWLLYLFLTYMFDFASKRNIRPFDFAASLLSFTLLVFMPLLIYSAIICSLHFLFQKEEISFLFTLPVKRIQIFEAKFLQTFYKSSWVAFCGILTFIIAVQTYFHISPLIYLGAVIASIAYLLIPVSLGVILTLVLSRIIPFVRAKGLLTIVGLFVGSLIILAIRMMQPERLATVEGKLSLLTFIEGLHRPWMTVLPNEWLNNVCASYYQGDITGIWVNTFALVVVAFFFLVAVYILAKAFYVRIWTESLATPAVIPGEYRWKAFLKIFPAHLRAFVKKDILTFYRDTVERGSLLLFIPMTALYFYSMYVLAWQLRNYGESTFSFLYEYLFNLFYAGIVICGLAGRWVFPSLSGEGSNFKLLRLAAIPLRDFVKEKLWLGFIPLFIMGQILVVGSCLIMGISLELSIIASFIMLILTFGIVSIGVTLGARMADFSVKEPLDVVLGHQGIVFVAVELLFIIGTIVLTGIPLAIYLSGGPNSLLVFALIADILAFGLFFYFGVYISYRSAITYLERRDI